MKMFAIAALAALIATPALAQEPQCGPLSDGLAQLAKSYKEHVVWVGRSADSEMMLTQSDDHRTWTWLGIKFQGDRAIACVLDSGNDGHIAGAIDSGSVAFFTPRGVARKLPQGAM